MTNFDFSKFKKSYAQNKQQISQATQKLITVAVNFFLFTQFYLVLCRLFFRIGGSIVLYSIFSHHTWMGAHFFSDVKKAQWNSGKVQLNVVQLTTKESVTNGVELISKSLSVTERCFWTEYSGSKTSTVFTSALYKKKEKHESLWRLQPGNVRPTPQTGARWPAFPVQSGLPDAGRQWIPPVLLLQRLRVFIQLLQVVHHAARGARDGGPAACRQPLHHPQCRVHGQGLPASPRQLLQLRTQCQPRELPPTVAEFQRALQEPQGLLHLQFRGLLLLLRQRGVRLAHLHHAPGLHWRPEEPRFKDKVPTAARRAHLQRAFTTLGRPGLSRPPDVWPRPHLRVPAQETSPTAATVASAAPKRTQDEEQPEHESQHWRRGIFSSKLFWKKAQR